MKDDLFSFVSEYTSEAQYSDLFPRVLSSTLTHKEPGNGVREQQVPSSQFLGRLSILRALFRPPPLTESMDQASSLRDGGKPKA